MSPCTCLGATPRTRARWRNCRDPRLEQRAFDEAEDGRLAQSPNGSARATGPPSRARSTTRRAAKTYENERTHQRRGVFDHGERRVIDSSIDSSSKKATQRGSARGGMSVPEPGPGALELDRGGGCHPAAARGKRGRGRWAEAARGSGAHAPAGAAPLDKVLSREEEGQWRPEEDEALRSLSPRRRRRGGGGRDAPGARRARERSKTENVF